MFRFNKMKVLALFIGLYHIGIFSKLVAGSILKKSDVIFFDKVYFQGIYSIISEKFRHSRTFFIIVKSGI